MQVLFLPDLLMFILCFTIWPAYQILVSVICLKIPDKYYKPDSFIFRSHKWEKNGKVYSKIFKVQKWKKFLPDGGAVIKSGYKKRHLMNFSKSNMEKFLIESCRGEMSHWLSIIPFWAFGFIAPPQIIIFMFLYAIGVNVPCIIAQRYNRPRIFAVLLRL